MGFSHCPGDDGDPRRTGEYVRQVHGGDVTLVGVVHDHPASVYRVRRIIETRRPDVLALELPPLAVPLFEEYARHPRTPPAFGGEMSAAIQATDADTVVGIDRPSGDFLRRLGRNLVSTRPSPATVGKVLEDVLAATKHALVCRGTALLATHLSVRVEVDSPVTHDVGWDDTPTEQARDEARQVRKSRSFASAVKPTGARRATALADATREELMARRLRDCRDRGRVLAVVGIDHLDPLTDHLDGAV